MNIPDLKKLKQLVKLCRETGIDSMEIEGIKFTLGLAPQSKPRGKQRTVADDFPEASIKVPAYNPTGGAVTVPNEDVDFGTSSGVIISTNQGQIIADTIVTNELTAEQLLFYSATSENQAQGD